MSSLPQSKEVESSPRNERVEVTILGQRMVLKSAGDAQRIERLAAYVNRKIDEASSMGPVPSQKLAVLAALNIAEDYFKVLEESQAFKQTVATKSRDLLGRLPKL